MSDAARATRNKLWTTPLLDLLRGRITGRADWRAIITDAGLPVQIADLVLLVVKSTRLHVMEKAAVASELIAHFQDGLTAGNGGRELIQKFGDPSLAAKLIRRAKRRGRSILFRAWLHCLQLLVVLAGLYVVQLYRFEIGRPTISVDYVARLNEPILRTDPADRAWPLWRKAILAASDGMKDGRPVFSETMFPKIWNPKSDWKNQVAWLNQHAAAVELARQAAVKPALGFILGEGGSSKDTELGWTGSEYKYPDQPVIAMSLPHLTELRKMCGVLELDARLSADKGDAAATEADLLALLNAAKQLHDSGGLLISQFVGFTMYENAVCRLESVLANHPDLLSDQQLIRLAHALAGPKAAADLIDCTAERASFQDFLQRAYTDDGHGDGHVTRRGFEGMSVPSDDPLNYDLATETMVCMLVASRAEMTARYNQLMDQMQANFQLPMRLADADRINQQLDAWRSSPVDRARFWLLITLVPKLQSTESNCERFLGTRDGIEVAIALELFHRHLGSYPATLGELTPEYLPEIPADRITGNPVKYRLIDGKPVVYSVGMDRIDDGGGRPEQKMPHKRSTAAQWEKTDSIVHGDWVLYPPDPGDSDEN